MGKKHKKDKAGKDDTDNDSSKKDASKKDAAADPLGVPLSGLPGKAVTRGYHLLAMPGNRVRVAVDWALDAVLPRQAVQLGLVHAAAVPLDTATPELPARSRTRTAP